MHSEAPFGAWVEVVESGAVGPDFGWPPEADRFAYLGKRPTGFLTWSETIFEWADAGGASGEGQHGTWAKIYLTAGQLDRFLQVALNSDDPSALTLRKRINARHRYIVSAREAHWRFEA